MKDLNSIKASYSYCIVLFFVKTIVIIGLKDVNNANPICPQINIVLNNFSPNWSQLYKEAIFSKRSCDIIYIEWQLYMI